MKTGDYGRSAPHVTKEIVILHEAEDLLRAFALVCSPPHPQNCHPERRRSHPHRERRSRRACPGPSRRNLLLPLLLHLRYPRASALGLVGQPRKRGFSPWGMPSYPSQTRRHLERSGSRSVLRRHPHPERSRRGKDPRILPLLLLVLLPTPQIVIL